MNCMFTRTAALMELLGGDAGRDLRVAAADEERVQGPVAGAAVELRLVREVVDHDQDLVELFEAYFFRFSGDLLLLLDDAAQGPLVPFVEIDLLPVRVDAHVVLDEIASRASRHRMAEIRATVFPDFEGPRKIPVHGTRGTIGSRGCFEVYSAVGKSFTFPI